MKSAAEEALEHFIAMREAEGERMKRDVMSRLDKIEEWVGVVETRSPQVVEDYRKRLYDKMCEVLSSTNIDENRILMEAGIFSKDRRGRGNGTPAQPHRAVPHNAGIRRACGQEA